MGVTIHYRGQLRNPTDLPEIVRIIKAQADQLGWRYHLVDERILGIGERDAAVEIESDDGIPTFTSHTTEEPLDDRWRGIVVYPPQCEWLFLTFNRQGLLINYGLASSDEIARYGIYETQFCKTQFGSVQTHIAVCQMLRSVAPYASEWYVSDEGGYYETGDVTELENRRGVIEGALQRLSDSEDLKELLDEAGVHVNGAPTGEVGKVIEVKAPAWRTTWSEEHSES